MTNLRTYLSPSLAENLGFLDEAWVWRCAGVFFGVWTPSCVCFTGKVGFCIPFQPAHHQSVVEWCGAQAVGRRQVLVVDDNETVARLLAEQIQQMGCDVQICHGGEDALRIMGSEMPDFVLLDINMPDMSGELVAREIERNWGKDATQIWFVTGNPLANVRGLGSGMLVKPVDSQKLGAIIHSA